MHKTHHTRHYPFIPLIWKNSFFWIVNANVNENMLHWKILGTEVFSLFIKKSKSVYICAVHTVSSDIGDCCCYFIPITKILQWVAVLRNIIHIAKSVFKVMAVLRQTYCEMLLLDMESLNLHPFLNQIWSQPQIRFWNIWTIFFTRRPRSRCARDLMRKPVLSASPD